MSKGMLSLGVNSGEFSVFVKTGITALSTIGTIVVLWELPTGTIIWDGTIYTTTADTTATTDLVVETNEAIVKTLLTVTDAIITSIVNMAARTKAQLVPVIGTVTQRRVQVRNTAAGTGDGVYTCILVATRPGPEPGASA